MLSFIRNFIRVGKRYKKSSQLMKRLGKNAKSFSSADIMEQTMTKLVSGQKSDEEIAKEELFDLIESDPDLRFIMNEYGATRATLKQIYKNLVLNGAGQWAGGAYVPVAAISANTPLRFLLQSINTPTQYDEHNLWLKLSYLMVEYCQSGRLGSV